MTDRVAKAARQDVYALIDRRFDDFVEELKAYARVPTISARREAEGQERTPRGRSSSATASPRG